jgi:hypothetical protein
MGFEAVACRMCPILQWPEPKLTRTRVACYSHTAEKRDRARLSQSHACLPACLCSALSCKKCNVPSAFRVGETAQMNAAVKVSLCLTNYALRHEGVWGSGCIDPHFLDLGTSWRWVVSFTPLPLYPREKSLRYSFDRRLGGPQSRSGRLGEENSCPHRDSNSDPSVVQPVASRYPSSRPVAAG